MNANSDRVGTSCYIMVIQAALLGEKTPEQALNDAQSCLMDIAMLQ